MKTDYFDYDLPEELIAQTPPDKRTNSRLMILDRQSGQIIDDHFYNLPAYLTANDILVFNDTLVIPARLSGVKTDTGARIEILLLKEEGGGWEVLARPARRLKPGTVIDFNGIMTGEIVEKRDEGRCLVRFDYEGIFLEVLERLGKIPLPPYIRGEIDDPGRYQTVYADRAGSAAAPTAGLHFDCGLLEKIKLAGVGVCFVTLHIGLATFRPVTETDVREHKMHSEFYCLPEETASMLRRARKLGKRIIAVGTTSARTLEAVYSRHGFFRAESAETDIFIYPGYRFKAVDALITNFHLPRSTLLMMVSAFYDREKILAAYRHAIEMGYRFFSFGDAMFIV